VIRGLHAVNHPIDIFVRIALIAIALVLWFWTQKLISRKSPAVDGVGDRLHDMTAPLHAWLMANPRATNVTLIVTSAFIDLFGIYIIGATIFGPTVRPFVALLMLFALRQLCQGFCSLPFPKGSIWHYPGCPSLLVTYGTSNDFFFSGHTSIAVLGALELSHTGLPWLTAAAGFIAILEMATVIILRAHYMVDVFTAVFVAWGCEVAASSFSPIIDAWLHRMF
jgi:hypothetical protein